VLIKKKVLRFVSERVEYSVLRFAIVLNEFSVLIDVEGRVGYKVLR
jgi:hypothetical protein